MTNRIFNNIEASLDSELQKSKSQIYCMIAWFTNPVLSQRLISKAKEGVDIKVILSNHEWNLLNKEKFLSMINLGAEIQTFGSQNTQEKNFMHIKMCIIDGEKVISGSYNWTKNTNSNKEECTISNDSDDAKKCLEYFWAIWEKSMLIDFEQIEKNAKFDLDELESFEDRGLSPEQMDSLSEESITTFNQLESDMDSLIINTQLPTLFNLQNENEEIFCYEDLVISTIDEGMYGDWLKLKIHHKGDSQNIAVNKSDFIELLKDERDNRLMKFWHRNQKFPFSIFVGSITLKAPIRFKLNSSDYFKSHYSGTRAQLILDRDQFGVMAQKCLFNYNSSLNDININTERCFM